MDTVRVRPKDLPPRLPKVFSVILSSVPEQGRMAKASPHEIQKTILVPVPVHTRAGVNHKATPAHLQNLPCAAGHGAGFPTRQGSSTTVTNPWLPSCDVWGNIFQKWSPRAAGTGGHGLHAWLHVWARSEGNQALGEGSAGSEQHPKRHARRRGPPSPEGHPIPLLLTKDGFVFFFSRETRLEHLPAGGTACGGGSAKTPPGGAAVPGPSAGGCSSSPMPSSSDAAT